MYNSVLSLTCYTQCEGAGLSEKQAVKPAHSMSPQLPSQGWEWQADGHRAHHHRIRIVWTRKDCQRSSRSSSL